MVLVLHTRYDGILSVYDGSIDASHVFRFMFEAISIVGVNLFVLISGYFGIKLRRKSLCNFAFQVYYFAILAFVASLIFIPDFQLTKVALLKVLFPLSHNVWFVPSYLILMLISPILNAFIERTTARQLATYTSVLYLLTYIWTNVWNCTSGFGGYSWGFFIILYFVGATLRKWERSDSIGILKPMVGYLLLTTTILIIALIQTQVPFGQSMLWSYDCPLVLASSICLFLFFANLKIRFNKTINSLGASAFAVLLFHMSAVSHYFGNCEYVFDNFSGATVIWLTLCLVLIYYLIAFTLDQPRKWMFKFFTQISFQKQQITVTAQ